MSNTVARPSISGNGFNYGLRTRGQRKYLNFSERRLLAYAAEALEPKKAALVLVLLWTGARITEVLNLRVCDIDLAEGVVALRTLKRRRTHIREVPVPDALLLALDRTFGLTAMREHPEEQSMLLFTCSRSTAWRIVKRLSAHAQIAGVSATPKGMRHGFGVGALQAGVPLTLVQRWLGHARLSTTAIYTQATGPEERSFAHRFWSWRERQAGFGGRFIGLHALRHAVATWLAEADVDMRHVQRFLGHEKLATTETIYAKPTAANLFSVAQVLDGLLRRGKSTSLEFGATSGQAGTANPGE